MDEKTKNIGFDQSVASRLPKGKKIVFGIGINAYKTKPWFQLNNAVRDVEAVASILRDQYDFDDVKLLINEEATRANIENALYHFTDPKVLGEDDYLLVYYSGHGHLDRDENGYWVPVDATGKDSIASYLSNSRIRELIAGIKCRHVLLISDACFSGSFFGRRVRGSGHEKVAKKYEQLVSRWAFCSGRHDEVVSDGPPGGHSPFAAAILQELTRNKNEKIHIMQLAVKVIEITFDDYPQLPEANPINDDRHKGGQFVFTPKNYKERDPVPNPNPMPKHLPLSLKGPVILVGIGILFITVLLWNIDFFQGLFSSKKTETTELVLLAPPHLPDTIDLGQIQTIQFRVKNIGTIDARLKPLIFSPINLTIPENREITITPGDEKTFSIQWNPLSSGWQADQITLKGEKLKMDLVVQFKAFVKEKIKELANDPNISLPSTILENPAHVPTPAMIVPLKNNIDLGQIQVGASKDYSFTLRNTGGSLSSKLETEMVCDDGSGSGGELEEIIAKGSRTYTDIFYAGDTPGERRCTLTISGYPVKIVIKAKVISNLKLPVEEDLPANVDMWLITDDGKRIDAKKGKAGNPYFPIPVNFRGKSVKVFFFNKDGKEDWKRMVTTNGDRWYTDQINIILSRK